jgi:hypothetical protein
VPANKGDIVHYYGLLVVKGIENALLLVTVLLPGLASILAGATRHGNGIWHMGTGRTQKRGMKAKKSEGKEKGHRTLRLLTGRQKLMAL